MQSEKSEWEVLNGHFVGLCSGERARDRQMVGQTVVLQNGQCETGECSLQHPFPGIKYYNSHPAAIKTTHMEVLKSLSGKSYRIYKVGPWMM